MKELSEDPFDVAAADEEAVGCGTHRNPECLCDVIVDTPCPIRVDVPADFYEWAERKAQVMNALEAAGLRSMDEIHAALGSIHELAELEAHLSMWASYSRMARERRAAA